MQTYGKTSTVKDGEIPVKLLKTAAGPFAEADFGAFGLWLDSPADADRGIRAFALAKSLLLGETSDPLDVAAISRRAARKTARDLLAELPSPADMDGAGPDARSPHFWIGRLSHAVASLLEAETSDCKCGARPYAAGSEGDDGTECILPAGHDGPHDDGPVPQPAADLSDCKCGDAFTDHAISGPGDRRRMHCALCTSCRQYEPDPAALAGIAAQAGGAGCEITAADPRDPAGMTVLRCTRLADGHDAHYDDEQSAFFSVRYGMTTVAPVTFAGGSRM